MTAAGSVAAFFDVDHTVLSVSSGQQWVRYLRRSGRMTWPVWWTFIGLALRYYLGLLEFPRANARLTAMIAGADAEAFREETRRWFEEWVRPYIAPGAVRRIAWHREQGHRLALVSAATEYVVRPLAEALDIPDHLCTRLEVVDGRLTGRVVEPPCYGPGKVYWVERYAAETGVDLARSYFYSDSYTDLPLLLRVGHPVAVNPDPRLRRLARRRGWPIERFY
ncbi:MAG: HAD-IB family hydrolase [Thermoflexus sp.]|uniref:HAD family hydrolase n=1 Tax=Thermoflexus sp. TaxID=1969742 RepID=UPI0033201B49